MKLRLLISGASVAGPTAAYWLCRQGFAVTVVERMPLTRVRSSGHAVLFGPLCHRSPPSRTLSW
jgi:2-polyprenyl-6-methoxyphenol hydroxylase-like FAD-dependent oxidoreductase